jgi:hypothetical protein
LLLSQLSLLHVQAETLLRRWGKLLHAHVFVLPKQVMG